MKWLTLVLTYLPVILTGVVNVESALQGQPGESKKKLVLDAILAGAKTGEQIPEAHIQGISMLIDSIVASLNASGIFKKAVVIK